MALEHEKDSLQSFEKSGKNPGLVFQGVCYNVPVYDLTRGPWDLILCLMMTAVDTCDAVIETLHM